MLQKTKNRNKPKEYGTPNSTEVVRDANGNIIKYTTYGSDGKIIKEVCLTGKEHGDIPRPNVKEPKYNTNPKTGENFKMVMKFDLLTHLKYLKIFHKNRSDILVQ
ncbi:polymorphic toxin type 24 domain-containing protein [Lysinibacillus mangiferihumi]|uniref:polymorphic toxin type 24 domain-containing protein n=1 Tax=Lysinibacillus mangiferihumi TaxID=1130819 RepID=UPI001F2988AA|nr:polymorphic toxin type 24 domain-containing protein [Lysinibacillus mangiferihumi]